MVKNEVGGVCGALGNVGAVVALLSIGGPGFRTVIASFSRFDAKVGLR